MIATEQRSLLTDALTPPAGYVFEAGVATTFSLDLITLLTLPLHLAWLGSTESGTGQIDPLPVFEALRRTADRLTVFCHAGRMHIPRSASPLLALMEGMVHEVLPRHGGAFHPKVWLLKFVGSSPTQVAKLRLLVLSRNLTDDRSWDVSLNLDGEIGRSKQDMNQFLKSLLAHTFGLSRKPLTPQRQADLDTLLGNVQRCNWELPPGFDALRFHALGIGKKPVAWWPQPDAGSWDELGVVSPFVSAQALAHLAGLTKAPLFLVCRPDEMDKQPVDTESYFEATQVLAAQAEVSDQDDDVLDRISGLHAKVIVGKRGWNTHLFLGSANATDAALLRGHNVEFMAELMGRGSRVGWPADWIGADGLGALLTPYVRSEPTESESERQTVLRLEAVRDALVGVSMHLVCKAETEGWSLTLHAPSALPLDDVAVTVWPLSLSQDRCVAWPGDPGPQVFPLAVLAEQYLTSFTGFSMALNHQELAFAINLPIEGLPESRDLSILRAALGNRDGFVRYLLLLLGHWDPQGSAAGEAEGVQGGGWGSAAVADTPLFELLVRAYSRDPERLAHVGQVLARLETDPMDAPSIVPAEFFAMWKIFQQAQLEDAAP